MSRRTPPYRTRTGVAIGLVYTPRPAPIDSRDALLLQRALLDPRTGTPLTGWRAALGALWRWL